MTTRKIQAYLLEQMAKKKNIIRRKERKQKKIMDYTAKEMLLSLKRIHVQAKISTPLFADGHNNNRPIKRAIKKN